MEKIKNRIWNLIHSENKLPKKNQLLIVFLVGVLLLVIVIPVPSSEEKREGDSFLEEKQTKGQQEHTEGSDSLAEYEAYLEKRVASALEYVEGVGKTEVVITLKSSSQRVVEKDQTSDNRATDEQDSSGGTRTEEFRTSERTSVYEQSSDGSRTPYVSKELTPEIAGVIVIAQGGDNAVVVQNITEAIQALFGVEAHKIKIMKRTAT
ncbi:stage III sporulation protein AG [Mediterraneibacter agrestimuris]|uniref:stage III sporulation protein AG n=1 Tax=Mediterraneibacter agrestimuris TaxID=2941333 RepID=UPI00203EBE56|nr:stage III sporulation protein AG [Mediterraneibacter agrestimuris]